MSMAAANRLLAGTFALTGLLLSYYVHFNWLYLTTFVGLNLLQSGFTRWCPAIGIFRALGLSANSCTTTGMSINQGVHIIAGLMIVLTTSAVLLFSAPIELLYLTALVSISLLQSVITGWCPAFTLARLMGFKAA